MQVKVSKHEQKLHYKHDFAQYHDRDRINLLYIHYVYVWRVVAAINSSFNDTQIKAGGAFAFYAFVQI